MTIDMHVHWIPGSLADALRARSERPAIRKGEDGRDEFLTFRGLFPLDPGYTSLERQIALMDKHGVDKAMLSLAGLFGIDIPPIDVSLPLVRTYNDAIAEVCRDHPDRFVGMVSLPWADMDAAREEFDRAMALPGIVGAILPGNGFRNRAAAEPFHPILEAAQRFGAHLMVHPGPLPGEHFVPPPADADNAVHRSATLLNQAETSSVMVTLCLTDLLEPYPDATIQVPDLGGNIALEVERMDYMSAYRRPEPVLPSERIRRCYIDVNTFGPRAIEVACQAFGADKLLIGTDGSDFGMQWVLGAAHRARIAEDAREKLLGANAARLIDRAMANKVARRGAAA